MPVSRKEKEDYLIKMIQIMGADGESATEEIFLLEIIASNLGLTRLNLMSLILVNATRKLFPGDYGSKVLASFLKNMIDPKGKSDKQNHENIAKIYEDIADAIPSVEDSEEDRQILKSTFEKATETFLQNDILLKEFKSAGLDFKEMLEYESRKVFIKRTSHNGIWI